MWGQFVSPKTTEDIRRLIEEGLPESGSLEYKRSLNLGSEKERLETLKDLTGMGNGGGGTIIYGIEEAPDREGVPAGITPLIDQRLCGIFEDVVRSGVRPPLLMSAHRIPWDTGYVLVVQVLRSSLGPYMVEGYGERRYYVRRGARTFPMGEQEVRDAYALALRSDRVREEGWKSRQLPLRLETKQTYLAVSAIPLGPEQELLEAGAPDASRFRPPDELGRLRDTGRFGRCTQSFRRWAEGVYGAFPDPPDLSQEGWSVFRLHRDGAVGLTCCWPSSLRTVIMPNEMGRVVNAQLVYVAWLWEELGVKDVVEIDVRLVNPPEELEERSLGERWVLQIPPGMEWSRAIWYRREVEWWNVWNARVRHGLVWRFASKICEAYDLKISNRYFREGVLYDQQGKSTGFVAVGGGIEMQGGLRDPVARIDTMGRVSRLRDDEVVGWFEGGVLMDKNGNAVAATELATGSGLPEDFVVRWPELMASERFARFGEPVAASGGEWSPPGPTQKWSELGIEEVLGGGL